MHLERQTGVLNNNKDLLLLEYKISEYIANKQYNSAKNATKQYMAKCKQNISLQMMYQNALIESYSNPQQAVNPTLAQILTKCQSSTQQQLEQYIHILIFRIKLTQLTNLINQPNSTHQYQLLLFQQICSIINQKPSLKRQLVGRLTGCNSIALMHQIDIKQIQQQTNIMKQSIMMNIASQWKYIIGDKSKSILMKKKSIQLIDSSNNYKSKLKAELNDLLDNKQTFYVKRLDLLAKMIVILEEIPDDYLDIKLNAFNIAKVGLTDSINYIKQKQQEINQQENIKSSTTGQVNKYFRKRNQIKKQIATRVQKIQEFYKKQLNKSIKGGLSASICSILYDCKFIVEKQRTFKKYFSIFLKLISSKKRYAFTEMVNRHRMGELKSQLGQQNSFGSLSKPKENQQ